MKRYLKNPMWAIVTLAIVLFGAEPAWAQTYTRLQPTRVSGLIDAVTDSIEVPSEPIGGFGSVKIQTLDTYTGVWEVQCSVNGTTFDADSELILQKSDSLATVLSVTDEVGIWTVNNAAGCRKIRVQPTSGFSGTDVTVAIEATQTGGAGGGGGGGGGAVSITDGVETALVTVGGALTVDCATCSGTGVSHVNNAAFTFATDDVVPIAVHFDDVAPTAATENAAAILRGSANRNLYTQIRDAAGNERGVNVTAGNALVVDGSAVTQPVTANAGTNLNTSALLTTAAHDAAFGTAGAADAQVRTIQGVASMTPVVVSATNLDVQSNGVDLATEATLASLLTSSQLLDDTIFVDNAAFTIGASKVGISGGVYQTTPATLADGDAGALLLDANYALVVGGASLSAINSSVGLLDNVIASTGAAVPSQAEYGCINVGGNCVAPTGQTAGSAVGLHTILWNTTTNAAVIYGSDPCATGTKQIAFINQTANAQILTGTASNRTYVCYFEVTSDANQDVALVSGTGSVCATSTGPLGAGGTTAADGYQFVDSRGIVGGSGGYWIAKTDTDADNVCVLQSGTAKITGKVIYVVAAA